MNTIVELCTEELAVIQGWYDSAAWESASGTREEVEPLLKKLGLTTNSMEEWAPKDANPN